MREGDAGVGAVRSTDEVGEPRSPRDPMEGRGGRRLEPTKGKATATLRAGNVSTKLGRIAELARTDRARVFTSVAHTIDLEWMREAYRRTRKDGAPGVDGRTAGEYAANLDANLRALVEKFHAGSYVAPPVRRAHIPKDGGRTRPIGIPTFEDKVLQRAVAMLLEAIYEEDFHPHSFGFRPGRSAHGALVEMQKRPTYWTRCWVLEADIQSFFDTLDHRRLRTMLDARVRDGTIRRTLDKWLKSGVLESGRITLPDEGTPQGGVISPLLSNIYLHVVLDRWYEDEVRPRMQGRTQIIRYADDFVMLFEHETDARRVMNVLPKRFARFGLVLHPEKTRLLSFDSPGLGKSRAQRERSFDFLGFTHFWVRSRRGRWIVRQRTSKRRFSRSLTRVKDLCRRMRHRPIAAQHARLSALLRGHYNYFGVTGNGDAIRRFRNEVEWRWGRSLARRNDRRFAWARFVRVLEHRPLPQAKTVRSAVPSEPIL